MEEEKKKHAERQTVWNWEEMTPERVSSRSKFFKIFVILITLKL